MFFATPFRDHRKRPAERSICLFGRPERAGRPRSNFIVPAQSQYENSFWMRWRSRAHPGTDFSNTLSRPYAKPFSAARIFSSTALIRAGPSTFSPSSSVT